MTKASETYRLIEPFLKRDMASLYQKGKSKGQDTNDIFIQLFDVSKEVIFDYSYSEAGLVAALAASASGDLIYIPAGTLAITAAFTIPTGVTLTGAGEYATFITATGDYGDLIPLSSDSCIENLNINYTGTGGASTKLMTLVTNHSNQIIRNIHAYFYPSANAPSHCFHTGTNTEFKLIENCIFVCDGNGGERTGMYASTIGGVGYIRDVYAYATCNTASVYAFGIYLRCTTGGPLIMTDSYGSGYSQGGTIGWGIFAYGTVKMYSCYGKGRTGTAQANGIEVQSGARAYAGCFGDAMNDGGGTTCAWINNASYMQDCDGQATSGTRYGVMVFGTAYAYYCRFDGATADILLQAGCNFHMYACQYDGTTGAGTITKDEGDLSIGTGTAERIPQWADAIGNLEDSGLIGPTTGLLQIENAAAGAGAIVDFGLIEGETLTINTSGVGNKTVSIAGNGTLATCPGTEVANTLAKFTAAATLDDIANGTGYLYNNGAGSYSYVPLAEAPAWAINIDGTLATATNVGAFVSPGDGTILAVYIYCKTLGTADSTIVDCNIGGVTIFTDQGNRPTLAHDDADGYDKSGDPDIATLSEGDIVTFDIDAVATGAADIAIILAVKWASISVAPIDAKYIVGAANGTLSAEIVKDYLEDNHSSDPDAYPSSPTAWDDEFEGGGTIDVKWTKVNDPLTDALNQTNHPGFLHVGLAEQTVAETFDNQIRLYQAPPVWNDGDGTWEYVAKVAITMTGLANEYGEYCGIHLYLGNSANDEFISTDNYINDSAQATSFVSHRAGSGADNGSGGFTGMTTNQERGIAPGQFVYLKLQKYTGSGSGDYDQPHTYNAYASTDGIIWEQTGTISKDFTTVCNEIGLMFRRPKSQAGTPYGNAIVDFFRRIS